MWRPRSMDRCLPFKRPRQAVLELDRWKYLLYSMKEKKRVEGWVDRVAPRERDLSKRDAFTTLPSCDFRWAANRYVYWVLQLPTSIVDVLSCEYSVKNWDLCVWVVFMLIILYGVLWNMQKADTSNYSSESPQSIFPGAEINRNEGRTLMSYSLLLFFKLTRQQIRDTMSRASTSELNLSVKRAFKFKRDRVQRNPNYRSSDYRKLSFVIQAGYFSFYKQFVNWYLLLRKCNSVVVGEEKFLTHQIAWLACPLSSRTKAYKLPSRTGQCDKPGTLGSSGCPAVSRTNA